MNSQMNSEFKFRLTTRKKGKRYAKVFRTEEAAHAWYDQNKENAGKILKIEKRNLNE